MMKYVIAIILPLIIMGNPSYLLLDGVPFEFELGGPISYTPTSGGINIPGYIMRIGYTKHQWIGTHFSNQRCPVHDSHFQQKLRSLNL